jgi:hypothetical protein
MILLALEIRVRVYHSSAEVMLRKIMHKVTKTVIFTWHWGLLRRTVLKSIDNLA